MSPWLAIVCAGAIATAGRGFRWLTTGGAAAAAGIGALVFWGAGLTGATLLGMFFISGSALTSWNQRRGAARDARQVLANGGWAAAGAVAAPWRPDIGWALLFGSLASAQADTWATEIGLHAARPPRLITTGLPVAPGTSGGVTLLGTAAGVAGALLLAALGLVLGLSPRVAAVGALAGVLGMLLDSFLGATAQEASWLDNDGVNLAATSFGAAVTAGLLLLLPP